MGRDDHRRGPGRAYIGANAYLGAEEILPALETGADVVITGRVADPSLFVAPLRRHFGWDADDWAHLGPATAVGHLLECASQVTGGYFADPGYKGVEGLAYVGFPFAEVRADGSACITKLDGTGGVVDERTVKEQLLYEVHDPAHYLTPDVTADFSTVSVAAAGNDRVRVDGAGGAPRPERLKVTVAFDGGWLAEAGVSYAGEGAQERAELAGDIVLERMRRVHGTNAPVRIDPVGVRSLHATACDYPADTRDVRLRCAMRASSRDEAELLLWEVESLLCCGPSAGGGYRGAVSPSVVTCSASHRPRCGLAAGGGPPGMSGTVTLREIAHARAGDKGNRSNVSVFAFDPEHYDVLRDQLTAERLKRELGALLTGPVVRYELPLLAGFNFVMDDALEGGVNESLNLDGHGKSWSSLILGLKITLPPTKLPAS